MTRNGYRWATPGDVNAFFGLMLDNIADLLLMVTLLAASCQFPVDFALAYMVPGTAIGVFVGDILYFWLAFRLARKTGRSDVTAMPLGLDTPSTFGITLFVLADAYRSATAGGMAELDAARLTWHIGICVILISGIFKLGCSISCNWLRRIVPRAGLLGSLAAIALVIISFIPLLDILSAPLVGMVSLAIVLTTLVARIRFPFRIPGALGALLVAGTIYYALRGLGLLHVESPPFDPHQAMLPKGWFEVFRFEWVGALHRSLHYLPIVIPFALATVVGGIDCTESAAAAGDDYDTRTVIGIEGIATVVASLCGGVIQTTPYIGHPAYKAMGGRAAYALATAFFVGGAGVVGYFGYLYLVIPKAAVFPILVFIGLEITAQSFHVTPARHYPALALAVVPAMAKLITIFTGGLIALLPQPLEELNASLATQLQTIHMISAGFIVTSLIWASALAALIDRRLKLAALWFGVAALCSLFGIIHSPLPSEALVVPWNLPPLSDAAAGQTPWHLAGAYLLTAATLLGWSQLAPVEPIRSNDKHHGGSTD